MIPEPLWAGILFAISRVSVYFDDRRRAQQPPPPPPIIDAEPRWRSFLREMMQDLKE